jgi:hypothetical protein
VRVTILASEAELDSVVDRIGAAICGAPDHPGPCATPWSIISTPVDDLEGAEKSAWVESAAELLEQRRGEPA